MSAQLPGNEGAEERWISKEGGEEKSQRIKGFGGGGVCMCALQGRSGSSSTAALKLQNIYTVYS